MVLGGDAVSVADPPDNPRRCWCARMNCELHPDNPATRPVWEDLMAEQARKTCKSDGCDMLAGDPSKGETGPCLKYCFLHCPLQGRHAPPAAYEAPTLTPLDAVCGECQPEHPEGEQHVTVAQPCVKCGRPTLWRQRREGRA